MTAVTNSIASAATDIRDIKPPIDNYQRLGLGCGDHWRACPVRIDRDFHLVAAPTRPESHTAANNAGARPGETKTGGRLGADRQTKTVRHRRVGRGAGVSRRAVSFPRAGAHDRGIFARAECDELALAGTERQPRSVFGKLRPGEIRQIRAGRTGIARIARFGFETGRRNETG